MASASLAWLAGLPVFVIFGILLKANRTRADVLGMTSHTGIIVHIPNVYNDTRDRIAYVRSFRGIATDRLVDAAIAEISTDYLTQCTADPYQIRANNR